MVSGGWRGSLPGAAGYPYSPLLRLPLQLSAMPPRPLPLLALATSALVLAGCDRGGSSGLDPIAECTPQNTVSLGVGEAERRGGAQARTLCVGGDAGAEYVLIPHFLSSTSGARTTLALEAEGTVAASGEPQPLVLGARVGGGSAQGGTLGAEIGAGLRSSGSPPLNFAAWASPERRGDPAARFDQELRIREQRELAPLLNGAGVAPRAFDAGRTPAEGDAVGAATPPLPSGTPALGSLLTLNAQAGEACTNPVPRFGEVMAVSQGAIVVADTARPANGFTPQDFQHFAATFDTLIAPVVHRNFGEPTDLDANGRVVLFFTPEVNRLTGPDSERFVGGFFFARDLFPRESNPRFQACAGSNVGEVLYLLVPDPTGSINGNIRQTSVVRRTAPATIGHELQHLVNAARRLHTLALPVGQAFEDVWLNEGLSHMAEELLFFEAAGLAPGANLDLAALQGGGARVVDAVNAYHVANLNRYRLFLQGPETRSAYDSTDNLEARGAAQQFLRYAADRRQGSDEGFFRALVDGPQVGWANLATRVGGETTLRRWYSDWSVANYADDRVSGISPDFRLQSWSHPTIFQGLQVDRFPIRTRPLGSTSPSSLDLQAGGAAYFRFRVPGPSAARIVTSVGDGPIPEVFQYTLLRTR